MTTNTALFLLAVLVAPLVYLKWKVHVLAMDGRVEELRKMRKSRGVLFGLITVLATIICVYAGYFALALLLGVFIIFHFLEAYDPDLIFSCDRFIKVYSGRKHRQITSDDELDGTGSG